MVISENNNVAGQWKEALAMGAPDAGNSHYAGSMADTTPLPSSPRHLHKRRRLSRLLDKLAIQLRNNNHYPSNRWITINSHYRTNQSEDEAPLDLSVKQEQTVTAASENDPPTYVCAACGQTFAVHDRLAKHVASRHRNKTPDAARTYECEVCRRRFARSDMLTRHARLHSGVKPYACAACGQVFSRSDHLATHQRTHTGEKPYRCPSCPYAACRRDMITRHMRTHTRRPQPAS